MLRLIPLPCPTEPSFPLDHLYLEVVYGPLLGPAAVVVARHLGRQLARSEGPVSVRASDFALEVGLRSGRDKPLGQRSHLTNAFRRLEHVRIVRWTGPTDVAVMVSVPVARPAMLAKLPDAAVRAHVSLVSERSQGA